MTTNRLEAFSDGVIAIIITIMVLELKVPHGVTLADFLKQTPQYVSYGVSFLVVAIMWVNHHHLMHAAHVADGRLLWANNNLLFWMSLIPFATAYVGEHHEASFAAAVYGGVFTLCALGFTLLRAVIVRQHRAHPEAARYHLGILRKNLLSMGLYAVSVPLALVSPWVTYAIFVLVAASYFLPERRLLDHESHVHAHAGAPHGHTHDDDPHRH